MNNVRLFTPAKPGMLRVIVYSLKDESEKEAGAHLVCHRAQAEIQADDYNADRPSKHLVCLVIDQNGAPVYGLGQLLKPESEGVREHV